MADTLKQNLQVNLVPLGPEHLDATFRWLCDAELRRRIDSLGGEPTRQGNEAYWQNKWQDKTQENYAILDSQKKHVGNCGLSKICLHRKKAELWIYLGEKRRSGLGREACRKLLHRAFQEIKLNRVYVRVLADNGPAISFFRALGFSEEGRFRDDTFSNGRFVDSVCLGLLAKEYGR
ncbi:MAG: GNAT family N-acetyltransferase [Candidatus Omnitrophica bacterium]|nr:GNAT family N-acetyltransferase [Candidatus Omnitrophota bacterium]